MNLILLIAAYLLILFFANFIINKNQSIKRYLLFATMFTSTVGGGTLIGLPIHIKETQDVSIIIGLIIADILSIAFLYLYKEKILQFSNYLDILETLSLIHI